MKKIFIIFALFTLVLGINTLSAQTFRETLYSISEKKISKEDKGFIAEIKETGTLIFWRVETKSENILFILSDKDYEEKNYSKTKMITFDYLSLLGNYIEEYYRRINNKISIASN